MSCCQGGGKGSPYNSSSDKGYPVMSVSDYAYPRCTPNMLVANSSVVDDGCVSIFAQPIVGRKGDTYMDLSSTWIGSTGGRAGVGQCSTLKATPNAFCNFK